MFQKHPILGVGPFMAIYNFYKYRPAGFTSPPRSWFASHNQYLQLLAEKGIFGFFIFIGFILLILKHINQAIKEHSLVPLPC
jgi:O-antigen ligase